MTNLLKWLRVFPMILGVALIGVGCGGEGTTDGTGTGIEETDVVVEEPIEGTGATDETAVEATDTTEVTEEPAATP